jgi:hypothetical protein
VSAEVVGNFLPMTPSRSAAMFQATNEADLPEKKTAQNRQFRIFVLTAENAVCSIRRLTTFGH